MTETDIQNAFYKAVEEKEVQETVGIDARMLYEIRSKRRYKTTAAQLEILWKAGKLKLIGSTSTTTKK